MYLNVSNVTTLITNIRYLSVFEFYLRFRAPQFVQFVSPYRYLKPKSYVWQWLIGMFFHIFLLHVVWKKWSTFFHISPPGRLLGHGTSADMIWGCVIHAVNLCVFLYLCVYINIKTFQENVSHLIVSFHTAAYKA